MAAAKKSLCQGEPGGESGGGMSKSVSIVIAEDRTMLRDCISLLVSSQPHWKVVGEAGDGLETIRLVQKLSPDLVLMDLSMPKMTGLDAIKDIKKNAPQTKIIVVTMHDTEEYILAALQAGADGYVLKSDPSIKLLMAIREVLDGRCYLSPSISSATIELLLEGKKDRAIQSACETVIQPH
ncbi:MAG: response regulator transcription factor [Deltaproteobacteria bacterium]